MVIEEKIRTEAGNLGFAGAGFAAIGPGQTLNRFQSWLSDGFAGQMSYLKRNIAVRANPEQLAPGAISIIVVAAPYQSSREHHSFSNYARGKDYHNVLRTKLRQLSQKIQSMIHFPLKSRICIDSAPVLEREWAVRAGLGWIGKQGSLVHPEFGCCLFLGELFVNLKLQKSVPFSNQCGECQLCIKSCPTGAIQANGVIDARRCISYLTTEYKGVIPESVWPLMGSSLFGCDRCTSACPWNNSGNRNILPEFKEAGKALPSPEECLLMNKEDFVNRFRSTSVYRIGLERLQRNAVIVLGNEGKKTSLALLKEVSLKNRSSLVQKHISWAIKQW